MEIYTGFSMVYDQLMDNVSYEDWCVYLTALLRDFGCREGLVLELGCGTGALTRLLAQAGYDMIGLDSSPDMLSIARERQAEEGTEILYLQQDMREFELYGTVAAVVSLCDSMNYITEYKELVQVFRLVNNYLDPGGYFIFDLNTPYKYRELLADNTFAENREDCSFIWENTYDDETELNEYALTLFVRGEDGRYERFEEFHYQKAYAIETVEKAAAEAGMEFIAVYDAFTREEPSDTGERVYVILKERGKSGIRKQ
ncbi:MAG: class I SAM-dependent methyltransferase [Lachnospiraceae bacterium]|nr:class I SAM-dependent methyltransferase [Lachnospiraceae bacterium]